MHSTPPSSPSTPPALLSWRLTAVGLVVLIYSTLGLMPDLVRGAWSLMGRQTVGLVFNGVVTTAGLAAGWLLWRRLGRRAWQGLLPLLAVGLVAGSMDNPAERLHFVEYALLGGVIHRALGAPAGWRGLLAAVLAGAAIGAGDEAIQYFLPSRVFDLRDIAMNTLGSALGVSLSHLLAPPPPPAQTKKDRPGGRPSEG